LEKRLYKKLRSNGNHTHALFLCSTTQHTHIDGTNNCISNALSCFQVKRLHRLAPKQPSIQIPSVHGRSSSYPRPLPNLRSCCINQKNLLHWYFPNFVLNMPPYFSQSHHSPFDISAAIWLAKYHIKRFKYTLLASDWKIWIEALKTPPKTNCFTYSA